MDSKCEHLNFEVEAKVSRIVDARQELRLMVSLLVKLQGLQQNFCREKSSIAG